MTSSSYESTAAANFGSNNISGPANLTGYTASSQSVFESNTGVNNTFAGPSNDLASSGGGGGGVAIQTSSAQETSQYLSQSGAGIFNDPNPQIVRRAAGGGPVTYQQRILVRFLQPPAVPPPGVIE